MLALRRGLCLMLSMRGAQGQPAMAGASLVLHWVRVADERGQCMRMLGWGRCCRCRLLPAVVAYARLQCTKTDGSSAVQVAVDYAEMKADLGKYPFAQCPR